MEQEIFFTAIKEGGTLVVLAFFVWYFMKQLADKDKRIDDLNTKFLTQETTMLNAISANTAAFDRLCRSIDRIDLLLNQTYNEAYKSNIN